MAILEKIKKNKHILNWDNQLQIILKGHTIFGTNIIKIFQYFMKSKVVTAEKDIPKGSLEVFHILMDDLDIPRSWIKQSIRGRKPLQWLPY